MKEMFCKNIRLFQNYHSKKETNMQLLERVFGEDSRIIDYSGTTEMSSMISDLTALIFKNTPANEIKDWVDYFLYEVPNLDGKAVIDDGDKEYSVNTPEEMFDFLNENDQYYFEENKKKEANA